MIQFDRKIGRFYYCIRKEFSLREMPCMKPNRSHVLRLSYAELLFVVLFWGTSSVAYSYFYQFCSATVLTAVMTFFSAVFFLFLTAKTKKPLRRGDILTALPICLLNAIACVLQRIGLQYTTPTHYAFLEHLSCVVVPVAVFCFTKKRPRPIQVTATVVCLAGCFVMSGMWRSLTPALGDGLCATAGILFGICLAMTAIFAKEMEASVFMLVHTSCYFLVSLITAIALDQINIAGVPLENAVFPDHPLVILTVILFGLVDIAFCWLLRTKAVQHIEPTTVAIISPFSAVITGILSVLLGMDQLSGELIFGGFLILLATLLPTLSELTITKRILRVCGRKAKK